MRARRWFGVVVALETLLCLALGARTLGKRSLWSDETVSALLARHGVGATVENFLHNDATMLPYNASLALWQHLGTSEAWLRALSLLACAATVPLVALIGRRLFDATTGMIGAGILAVSPFVIRYAQEARAYGMTLLLVTLTSYLLVRAVNGDGRGWWYASAASAALACYTHLHAALVVGAQLVVVATLIRPPADRRTLVRSGVLLVALLVPLGVVTLRHGTAQISWAERPTLHSVADTLELLGGSTDTAVLLAVLCLGAVAIGTTVYRTRGAADAWPYAFVTAWWATPIVATILVSLVATPIFVPRYLIIVLPGAVLAAGACLRRLPLALVFPMLLVIGVASASSLADRYRWSGSEDWRAVDAYVLSRAAPGDRVLFCPGFLDTPFAYYAHDDPAGSGLVFAERPRWWPDGFDVGRPADAVAVSSRSPSVWVVGKELDAPGRAPCPRAAQLAGRTHETTAAFGKLGVEHWVTGDGR